MLSPRVCSPVAARSTLLTILAFHDSNAAELWGRARSLSSSSQYRVQDAFIALAHSAKGENPCRRRKAILSDRLAKR